jgi:hypothetical protein
VKVPPHVSVPDPLTSQASAPRIDNSIIVVSGLPRSGTSMLMRMIAAGGVPLVLDDVRPADVDNPHGYFEFTPVKALHKPGNKEWLGAAQGKAIKVISFLLPHLPAEYHYKIIFIRRNLKEVLASQKKMLEHRGEPGGVASDDEMASTFAAHLTLVQNLLATRRNCDVLYVDHRQAIEDPAQVASTVNEFLGGRLDAAAMAAEIDRSLHRNRA